MSFQNDMDNADMIKMIEVNDVSMHFRLPSDRVTSIKEYVIQIGRAHV